MSAKRLIHAGLVWRSTCHASSSRQLRAKSLQVEASSVARHGKSIGLDVNVRQGADRGGEDRDGIGCFLKKGGPVQEGKRFVQLALVQGAICKKVEVDRGTVAEPQGNGGSAVQHKTQKWEARLSAGHTCRCAAGRMSKWGVKERIMRGVARAWPERGPARQAQACSANKPTSGA